MQEVLLVTATALEMRAALALLPGGPDLCDRAPTPAAPALSGSGMSAAVPPLLPVLSLPGARLSLLICGVGPVASGLALGRALGLAEAAGRKPAGVLNLGIAGSYDPVTTPLGSLVLANAEHYPEYGLWPEGDEAVRDGQRVSARPGDPLPLEFAQVALPSGPVGVSLDLDPETTLGNLGLSWHSSFRCGGGVTVAGVSGTLRRAMRMAALTGGCMENMEGFPLALGSLAVGLPFAELRAVSNAAGMRPPEGWDMPAALAALGTATRALFEPWLFAL